MNKFSPAKLSQYLLLIIGIGFLVPAVYKFIDSYNLVNYGLRANGEVIQTVVSVRTADGYSGEDTGIVRFATAQGEIVDINSLGISEKGRRVTVLYHPNSPHDGEVWSKRNLWYSAKFMGSIGFTAITIFLSVALYFRAQRNKIRRLLETGKKVSATITKVLYKENLIIAGSHPYQIFAQWQDKKTGETHQFKSKYLWEQPVVVPGHSQVNVYMDDKKKSIYHLVDPSSV